MLNVAIKMTEFSRHQYAWHGVVVTKGGAILAKGYNHKGCSIKGGYKHRNGLKYKNGHAEVVALNKLWGSERKGTTIWSIRYTPGGKLANAKPCETCELYLRENGVKLVIYSNESGNLVRMRL